jgi:hypothetical protein
MVQGVVVQIINLSFLNNGFLSLITLKATKMLGDFDSPYSISASARAVLLDHDQ